MKKSTAPGTTRDNYFEKHAPIFGGRNREHRNAHIQDALVDPRPPPLLPILPSLPPFLIYLLISPVLPSLTNGGHSHHPGKRCFGFDSIQPLSST